MSQGIRTFVHCQREMNGHRRETSLPSPCLLCDQGHIHLPPGLLRFTCLKRCGNNWLRPSKVLSFSQSRREEWHQGPIPPPKRMLSEEVLFMRSPSGLGPEISVLVADSNQTQSQLLIGALRRQGTFKVAHCAAELSNCMAALEADPADVLLQ